MLKQVYKFAALTRLVTITIGALAYYLIGSYDSSAEIQTRSSNLLNAFLRWDAIYFLHIAEHGYIYEQETAFFPVFPLLARLLAHTLFSPLKALLNIQSVILLSGIVISNVSFVLAAGALYKLTAYLLPQQQKRLAYTSSIAFCLSPPAMFMTSFYTESLFALCSFTGMYYVSQKKYFCAAIVWGFTSGIRSNAIVFSGFFFYDLVWIRSMKNLNFYTGILRSLLYTAISASGFALFQYYGYVKFCSLDRPWCHEKIPLLYTFVQKEYWQNGFLSYYEVKQIPNFLLAAPIVIISICGLFSYIRYDPQRFLSRAAPVRDLMGFHHSSLSVYMYLWLFLLFYVLTTMHVQVIIRFFTSLPPLYWYVGHLLEKNQKGAQIVLGYFVLYGLVGTVLFANFLPPA
ncbi:GPI mannosyltransferase 2 [Sporodiniella umbellata]|nr:GPI mannosyltransferase 2 [Sporodiniella umbellata]